MPDPAPIEIDIASDVVCPWCVIGWKQLERAILNTGLPATVRWHPFELTPDLGPEGANLREFIAAKYGTDVRAGDETRARITALGAELGFTFDYFPEMRRRNTFDAHRLLFWAGHRNLTHPLKMALFDAYFSRRQDIGEHAVLADAAASVGLDRAEAEAVLAEGRHGEDVRRAERFWTDGGITGVPAMVFQRRHLVTGAQGVEAFESILRQLAAAA